MIHIRKQWMIKMGMLCPPYSRGLTFSSPPVPFPTVFKVTTCRTFYQMTEHSKMYQNTPGWLKANFPHPVSTFIRVDLSNMPSILTRKQTWKAGLRTVADDILWVVTLIFDVYSLFFLSNFDSVPAKIQPCGGGGGGWGGGSKKLQSTKCGKNVSVK